MGKRAPADQPPVNKSFPACHLRKQRLTPEGSPHPTRRLLLQQLPSNGEIAYPAVWHPGINCEECHPFQKLHPADEQLALEHHFLGQMRVQVDE